MSVSHWNNTNDAVVNELWYKAKNLDSFYKSIFQPFIVSASVLVESLIGPENQNKDILDIDLKKINLEQFRQLYYILVCYFVVLYYFTNPFLKDELKKALFKVLEESDFLKTILRDLDKLIVNSRRKLKLGTIGGKVWEKVVGTIGLGSKDNPSQLVLFIMVSGEAYKQALINIKKVHDEL
jgi:hypothetical protein